MRIPVYCRSVSSVVKLAFNVAFFARVDVASSLHHSFPLSAACCSGTECCGRGRVTEANVLDTWAPSIREHAFSQRVLSIRRPIATVYPSCCLRVWSGCLSGGIVLVSAVDGLFTKFGANFGRTSYSNIRMAILCQYRDSVRGA